MKGEVNRIGIILIGPTEYDSSARRHASEILIRKVQVDLVMRDVRGCEVDIAHFLTIDIL